MRLHLLAFASAAEALGASEIELEVPDSTRVVGLRAHLESLHPELGSMWSRLAIAVDGQIVGEHRLLVDGCEVALLPPVSGGVIVGHDRSPRTPHLVRGPIDVEALIHEARQPGYGAITSFFGTVRDTFGGRPVLGIHYSAYARMAEERLTKIERELEQAQEGLRVRILHRLGELEVGDISVAIVGASAHRDAAYSACREALERVKKEVPIWKRERYVDGEAAWREEEHLQRP
jgi:molybdopterin synthase catalytic subunit/molybdopterin converting factor small subunit